MPVVMNMKWPEVSQSQYEVVRKTVNWEGQKPNGAIFHVASFGKDGLRVTDIWKSDIQTQSDCSRISLRARIEAVFLRGISFIFKKELLHQKLAYEKVYYSERITGLFPRWFHTKGEKEKSSHPRVWKDR